MELTPFTLDDAHEIREDFEDLIDTEFKLDNILYLVHNLVICPFDEQERIAFLDNYSALKNELPIDETSGVDVMLVMEGPDDQNGYTYLDIRSFATQKGISYRFPESV